MKQKAQPQSSFDLRMSCEVARQIRQHARGSSKAEVCGVLIGTEDGGVTSVEASIPGAKAVQGGTHVTFTQDTWEHIYQIKDRDYPNARIVGWYHSHPGFGVFLSDHDTFIHKNFFSAARQVAWVYDPHSDEEGCFGWVEEKLERLPRIVFVDKKGGEGAGETGKPEPLLFDSEDEEFESDVTAVPSAKNSEAKAMLNVAGTILSYLCVMIVGFLLCWILFPHYVGIPIDPRTGQPMLGGPSGFSIGGESPVDATKPNTPPAQANPMPPPQNAKGRP
jgi:proteasome lid subunit RPN8/RPN11